MALFVADQPKHPHGMAKAKGRALILFMDMSKAVPPYQRRGWMVSCFGNKSHYFPETGACVHVEEIRARLKLDWHRQRLWYLPFGDNEQLAQRVKAPA